MESLGNLHFPYSSTCVGDSYLGKMWYSRSHSTNVFNISVTQSFTQREDGLLTVRVPLILVNLLRFNPLSYSLWLTRIAGYTVLI